jgi:hypothetical protein
MNGNQYNGVFGVVCYGGTAQLFNVTDADIDGTGWGFRNNSTPWDNQARAAFALCGPKGFAGGTFNGYINGNLHGLLCYPATEVDAHDSDLDATGWGYRADNTDWARAARAAYGFCQQRGYTTGQMNGNIFNDLHGVMCAGKPAPVDHLPLTPNSGWRVVAGTSSGVALVDSGLGGGQLDAFVTWDPFTMIGFQHFDGQRWLDASWDMSMLVVGKPAAVGWGGGHIQVFARGPDNHLHIKYRNPSGTWTAWADAGGTLAAEPVAVENHGQLWVFAVQGGHLTYRMGLGGGDPGLLDDWADLGVVTWLPPGVAVTPDGYIDVAVLEEHTDFGIVHSRFDGGNWSAWQQVGVAGQPIAPPAIASGKVGQIDIVYVSTDYSQNPPYSIQHVRGDGVNFGPAQKIGGSMYYNNFYPETHANPYLVSAPLAVALDGDTLEVFIQGTDTHLWRNELWAGSWNGWEQVEGCTYPGAAAAAIARNGTIELIEHSMDTHQTLLHVTLGGNTPAVNPETPPACQLGDSGEICNAGRATAGASCNSHWLLCSSASGPPLCVSCGGNGQYCCADAPGCLNGLVCENTGPSYTCVPCGAKDQACCANNNCNNGLSCSGGKCEPACSKQGGACKANSDCCGGLSCNGGTCEPACVNQGGACHANSDCCGGLPCIGGVCTAMTQKTCSGAQATPSAQWYNIGLKWPTTQCAYNVYQAFANSLNEAVQCAQRDYPAFTPVTSGMDTYYAFSQYSPLEICDDVQVSAFSADDAQSCANSLCVNCRNSPGTCCQNYDVNCP